MNTPGIIVSIQEQSNLNKNMFYYCIFPSKVGWVFQHNDYDCLIWDVP